jgi:hypothetical protein
MARFKVKAFTGPVYVEEFGKRLSEAGFADIIVGTEHVYFTVESDGDSFDAYNQFQAIWKRIGIHPELVGIVAEKN